MPVDFFYRRTRRRGAKGSSSGGAASLAAAFGSSGARCATEPFGFWQSVSHTSNTGCSTPGGRVLAVVYADGAYDGKPFITTLKAKSVLVLRATAVEETNGRRYITVSVDSFVEIQQMGFEIVAKTVQPWLNKTADQNFIETLSFISNFSRTAEKNPQGMQRLATRLPSIDDPTRVQLVKLCYRAADRYAPQETATRTSLSRAQPSGANLLAHRPDVLTFPR
jgi:hypothetical protein